MESVKLDFDDKGNGHFHIDTNNTQLGEMVIDISGNELTVHHTEVLPQAEGKGLAKELFDAMVAYARKEKLKIIPLCTYVLAQLERHPDEYKSVWKRE